MSNPMDEHEQIRERLRERVRTGDNSGYDELYRGANTDPSKVPWAQLTPNVNVTRWLDRATPHGEPASAGGTALVVGCGLGDDAEELSRRGLTVTAFDIAPTAIEWCRRRFPRSRVNYLQADLLAPPDEWRHSFDFVLESYTIQAMSLDLRGRALRQVAEFVAPRGTLLIVCRARDDDAPPGELPYPLTRSELDSLQRLGLKEQTFEDYLDDESPPVRRFRASYRRTVA
jgi:SAM-dependent methyltransferase